MRRLLLLGAVASLAACAGPSFKGFVAPIPPEANAKVAYDIAAFVRETAKPHSTINVERAPGDDAIRPALVNDLQADGFSVVDGSAQHTLRFEVAQASAVTFVRVALDRVEAARPYRVTGLMLEPIGPFAVRGEDN